MFDVLFYPPSYQNNYKTDWYWKISMQPLMLVVPDVQDVYTPLETDVVVPLSEVKFGDSVPFMKFVLLLMSSLGGGLVLLWKC